MGHRLVCFGFVSGHYVFALVLASFRGLPVFSWVGFVSRHEVLLLRFGFVSGHYVFALVSASYHGTRFCSCVLALYQGTTCLLLCRLRITARGSALAFWLCIRALRVCSCVGFVSRHKVLLLRSGFVSGHDFSRA